MKRPALALAGLAVAAVVIATAMPGGGRAAASSTQTLVLTRAGSWATPTIPTARQRCAST